jgi:hypothetical protein
MQVVKEKGVSEFIKQFGTRVVCISSREDLYSPMAMEAIQKLSNSSLKELLDLLNSINGQGIKSINREVLTYDTDYCKNIDILDMCDAEKLFLFAFLAENGYFKLFLDESMIVLELTLFKRFLKTFKGDGIYIVCDDIISEAIERLVVV